MTLSNPGRGLILAALLSLAGATVAGSGTTFWVLGTASDLLKGTSEGVLIDRSGTISVGPKLTNLLTSAPAQIWCMAAGADGTLWAGTGGDGRVIRIRPGQQEETVLDAEENNVFAIAVSGTRVYAATGPDGKVYVIDSSGGSTPARTFFDPEEKYIWALAVDGNGRVWVGAGNPAVVYRVEPNGTSRTVYRPPAAHVVTLARDSSGRMLAGTESPGRLYRFDANDRPFVLLDAGLSELHAIAFGTNGQIYAAALNRGEDSSAGEAASVAAAIGSPSSTQGPAASSAPPAHRSVIFRIDSTGSWDSFWETPDLIYDIAMQADGPLLVSTGPEGRLYTLQPNREVFLHTGVDAKQITRLLIGGSRGQSLMATANPGRVIAMGPAQQSPATYVSPVRDTKSASTWGAIRWDASGPVVLYTRSGNTEKPDDSWSEWSGPYSKNGDIIQSPPGRFLQWKAVLTPAAGSATPRLTSVTAAYLTRNSRPSVTSVTVHPPGVVFQRPFTGEDNAIAGLDDAIADARRPPGGEQNSPSPTAGRRMFQKGLQTIAWKAEDADGDRLTYSVLYKREGDATWQELKRDLNDMIYVWDTTSMADGHYSVKVVASDDSSNTPDRALSGDRESESIAIDNTPPSIATEITHTSGASRLIVRVHDTQSAILRVEFSTIGGPWRLIYPVDGLADSPDERYEIPLANDAEASKIVIRATDVLQNVASLAVK